MLITPAEMVASVEQMMREACEEEGVEFNDFVDVLNDYFDARYEIVEM